MPWVHQWYDEDDQEWGGNPAEEFQTGLNRGAPSNRRGAMMLKGAAPQRAAPFSRSTRPLRVHRWAAPASQ